MSPRRRHPDVSTWPQLVVAVVNAGPAKDAGLARVGEIGADLILGQEFGDRRTARAALLRRRYGVNDGSEPGRSSTPTFYRTASMALVSRRWVRLLGAVLAGVGAGPSRLKPKGLNLTVLRHRTSRRMVEASAYHAPASQQFGRRLALARVATQGILRAFGARRVRIVGGDWNARGKWLDRLMWAAGWTSSDREGGVLRTHNAQNYDRVYWRRSRNVRFVSHHTIDVGSDHLVKVVTLAIRPRGQRRKGLLKTVTSAIRRNRR